MALRLLITDLDGTAVQYSGPFQSTWDAIGGQLPGAKEWFRVRDYFMHLPDRFQEWDECNRNLLRGQKAGPILAKILPPPYTSGFKECMAQLKNNGVVRGILSSGVDLVANYIAHDCNLDFVVSNEVHVQEGVFTGTGQTNVTFDQKGEWVRRMMREYGCSQAETAHCGDHFNDISAWEAAGIKIGVNLKRADLAHYVDVQVQDFFGVGEYLAKHV